MTDWGGFRVMAEDPTPTGGWKPRAVTPKRGGKAPLLAAGVVIAVGAAAVSLAAGIGAYLFIRFTQGRRKTPG